jgi:hypothetical protein
MSFPVGAEQREGVFRQRDVPIFGALAAVDMDLEALTINIGDLEEEGFMEPEAQAIDRGEVDLVVERGGGRQESPHFLHPEDSGKPVGGLCTQERERGPIALEDMLREEANTAVLAKYVLEWMKRLPELRTLAEEREKQWAQMFPAARFAFTIEEAPK